MRYLRGLSPAHTLTSLSIQGASQVPASCSILPLPVKRFPLKTSSAYHTADHLSTAQLTPCRDVPLDQSPSTGAQTEVEPNQLLWALLKKRGQVVISIMQTNEALAIRGLIGETGYADIRELDASKTLVIFGRSAQEFIDVMDIVEENMHPRRRRSTSSIGSKRGSGVRQSFPTAGATKLTALGVLLVIGVAALGGVCAGVVISYGPSRKSFDFYFPGVLCPMY